MQWMLRMLIGGLLWMMPGDTAVFSDCELASYPAAA